MEMYLEPFVDSSLADNVLRYHFGFEHPGRQRAKILKRIRLDVGKRTRRGSGTKSILASVALPFLVAEADRQESLAALISKSITRLGVAAVLNEDLSSVTPMWRRDVSERFTASLEKLATKEPELTVDKGHVVRIDGRWSLLAVGDPRIDSYRLERVQIDGLAASGLASPNQSFVRVWMQEAGRMARPVYLPAWEPDGSASPEIFEMLLHAKPVKPLGKGKTRFSPKRRSGNA